MKGATRLPPAAVAFTLALLLLGQCQRQDVDVAPPRVAPALASDVRPAAELPSTPTTPADDAEVSLSAPPSKGTWLDGIIYRFRLDGVRRCPPPPVGGGARVGAVVRVASKVDEVLVAARDFKLESGGVLLDSAILERAPEGCGPLLVPTSLRAGKSALGVVVFDVPAGFNSEGRPVKITYQPTRWGGARKVEAVLPPE